MRMQRGADRLSTDDMKAYTEERILTGLRQIRLTFFTSAILYGLFAFLDNLLSGEFLPVFLFIRFGIVIPLLLVFIALTYHPSFIRMAQPLVVLCVVAGGTGIVFMLIVYPDNFSYYGGIFMVISVGYFLSKLDTRHALFGGILTLFLYMIGYALYHGSLGMEPLMVVTFFAGANLIGTPGTCRRLRISSVTGSDSAETRCLGSIWSYGCTISARSQHAGGITAKNSALTPEEWVLMMQHPEIGYRIARATDEVAHVAEEILTHHERWDGTGYPRGLKGTEIPLLARITTLVDAFEVMLNGRPYKPAMTRKAIHLELRRCAGQQFDPELVDVFLTYTMEG